MNASNTIKLEIVASTEHKARVNAELAACRKHKVFFTKIAIEKVRELIKTSGTNNLDVEIHYVTLL